jgi:hypothetical protein
VFYVLRAIGLIHLFLVPSMFGRDLIEQVRADSRDGERMVPIIVEKCIEAVEAVGKSLTLPQELLD